MFLGPECQFNSEILILHLMCLHPMAEPSSSHIHRRQTELDGATGLRWGNHSGDTMCLKR